MTENKKRRSSPPSVEPEAAQALRHELRVHQAELQAQNEALRDAHGELEESRDRYYELYEGAPVAYVTLDAACTVMEANRAASVLFGVERPRLVGVPLQSLLLPASADDLHRFVARLAEQQDNMTCCEVDIRPRFAGGRVRGRIDATAERRSDGTTSFRCTIVDLSERLEAEAKLRASEKRFREIAETIEDAFFIREENGRVSYVSPACESIWDRTPAEICASADGWLPTIHSDDRARITDAYRFGWKGDPLDEEYRIRTPDGDIRWVRERAFVVDDGAERMHAVGVVHDVTTERVLEDELRQAQKMEAIGLLASGIAHDFNNMLHVIAGFAEIAGQPDTSIKQGRMLIERIGAAARRGSDLTRQLMTFARKKDIKPTALVFDRVVAGTEAFLRSLLTERIKLSLKLNAPMCVVMTDRIQIEQILLNLASNARDAMLQAGELTIETSVLKVDEQIVRRRNLRPAQNYVRMVVGDTGVGMDEETRRRVFEPFFSTKEIGKGTGLGLSTVFGIVRQSGGHIGLCSAPGQGTTFKVYLPRTDRTAKTTSSPPPSNPTLRGSETILVVEDEDQVRDLVRTILLRQGYNVLEAQNAGEAFLVCEKFPAQIHLILTDMVMPRMGGRELVERVRPMRPEMKILYMSGYTEEAIGQPGDPEDRFAFLYKPITPDALRRKVREVLARD